MFATALITPTQSANALAGIVDQIAADMPTLIAIAAGLAAIAFIPQLIKAFMSPKTFTNGSVGGMSKGDRKWDKFVHDNERVMARAREVGREADRLDRETDWVKHYPYRNFHENPGDGNDREYWFEHKWARWN